MTPVIMSLKRVLFPVKFEIPISDVVVYSALYLTLMQSVQLRLTPTECNNTFVIYFYAKYICIKSYAIGYVMGTC